MNDRRNWGLRQQPRDLWAFERQLRAHTRRQRLLQLIIAAVLALAALALWWTR